MATTTLPLATAGEDATGEAASYPQTFLPLARTEPVDAAVVGADEYAAAGDRRRRVDAGARRVLNTCLYLAFRAALADREEVKFLYVLCFQCGAGVRIPPSHAR